MLRMIAGAFVAASVLLGIYVNPLFFWFTLFRTDASTPATRLIYDGGNMMDMMNGVLGDAKEKFEDR